jgi:RimJ/RimL family protein N-acetyltransferase
MTNRADHAVCLIKGKLKLSFANIEDRKLIYDMLISEDIMNDMFNDDFPPPTYEEFSQEPVELFAGHRSKTGNYLMIYYNEIPIGSISYALNQSRHDSYELDIWISKNDYLGQGIGSDSLRHLMDYLENEFDIHIFMIRPWSKNIRAIKSYKKIGFKEVGQLTLKDYYSEEDYDSYGEGDYGDETVNLILHK